MNECMYLYRGNKKLMFNLITFLFCAVPLLFLENVDEISIHSNKKITHKKTMYTICILMCLTLFICYQIFFSGIVFALVILSLPFPDCNLISIIWSYTKNEDIVFYD